MPTRAATSFPAGPHPQLPLVVDGSGRVGPIAAIPRVLHELGVDAAEVAVNVGIELDIFDNPDNTIPFALMGRLFRACVVRSGCPHFGLLVGARSTVSSMGIVSQLMQHAPDVGTALRNLVLYLQLHDRGAVPSLEVEDGTVFLGYSVYQKDVVATDQIYDAAIAIGANIMRALCGPGFRPAAILLRRSAPVDGEPYRQVFKAPVRFDADQSALVFSAKWLRRPVTGADARLYQALEAQAQVLLDQMKIEFTDQVRRVLHALVVTRHASAEQTAFLFGIHRRTLNRRLLAQGTTFKALLQEVRFEIARQLLRETRMPMVNVAEALGYAAPGAFTRAFRCWSGQSPSAWRAALWRD